jgi:uncharacterized protein
MSVFADSSAVVKLYADEPGSSLVRAFEAMHVSQLCRVEVPAAIWRKTRMGTLASADAVVLIRAFENDLFGSDAVLAPARITPALLDDASVLTAAHGLRAYDAVQLATARAVRALDPECESMAAFDRELRDAAARDGFTLVPGAI